MLARYLQIKISLYSKTPRTIEALGVLGLPVGDSNHGLTAPAAADPVYGVTDLRFKAEGVPDPGQSEGPSWQACCVLTGTPQGQNCGVFPAVLCSGI